MLKKPDRYVFLAELMASSDMAGNRRDPNTAEFNKGLFTRTKRGQIPERKAERKGDRFIYLGVQYGLFENKSAPIFPLGV